MSQPAPWNFRPATAKPMEKLAFSADFDLRRVARISR